jgi:molybdate transport system substrate-binding protein
MRGRIRPYKLYTIAALVFFCGSRFAGQPAPRRADLTVSAAISMKPALDELQRDYTGANPGVTVESNYGASGTLQLQIEQGAPVDVYISASPKQMDDLQAKGLLLEETRKNLLRNEIVLVVPKDSSSRISSFQDLARPDVKPIALGEPTTVPAGAYAKEVLIYLGIYSVVKPKALLAKDVRQVLTYVETGNVEAGIVYSTDAASSSKVKVVATAPEQSHAPAIYPVAVIKTSKDPAAARAFEDFLLGAQARAVFQRYGFTSASP